jgi:hypothetical protein
MASAPGRQWRPRGFVSTRPATQSVISNARSKRQIPITASNDRGSVPRPAVSYTSGSRAERILWYKLMVVTRWMLSVLIVACTSCGWHPDTAVIPDAGRPAEVTLHARRGETQIVGLEAEGVADIQGDATIELVLNGAGYKTVQLHDHTNFTWGGDWYSPDAIVRYVPASRMTKGSITLKYRFKTL